MKEEVQALRDLLVLQEEAVVVVVMELLVQMVSIGAIQLCWVWGEGHTVYPGFRICILGQVVVVVFIQQAKETAALVAE